ncbi:MAG: nuclease-related domain-containing protein [Dehalococcoidia bacterium]
MTTARRQIRLRYPAVCATCGTALAPGSTAWWDASQKQATCLEHSLTVDESDDESTAATAEAALPRPTTEELAAKVESGVAGASAQREFERRRERREARIRAEHPHIGGLILALTNEPQSTRAWATGAEGERELGQRLDEAADRGAVALHDRRIPGTRANIDHIVVASAGVFVVDAKKYAGKVEKRDVGGFFKRDERLFVGRRDCSKLLDGMRKQIGVVRDVLAPNSEWADVPIAGALCFVGAEWGLFSRPIELDGITATWPKALVKTFQGHEVLSPLEIDAIARALGERLPPA